MADLFSQQFGQVGPTDDLDELVQRNIQEVLQAAQLQDDLGTSTLGEPPLRTSSSIKSQLRRNTSSKIDNAAATSASALPLASVNAIAAPAGTVSSSMLDVPGHSEATIRLHKARIKALEDENNKLVKSLADRDRSLSDAQKEVKLCKAEQQGWTKEKKTYEAQIERLQRRLAEVEGALAGKESVTKEVAKESTRLERERRAAEQEAKARDVRLQRALEEVDKYKAMLQELRSQEREGKDVAKADLNRLAMENKKLERQRGELLVAFKKQLKLIDVLKRQKVHLEAARALQFSENEFLQTLEMGNA